MTIVDITFTDGEKMRARPRYCPLPQYAEAVARKLEPLVNSYLMAKAFAQCQREAVDKIERQVLSDNAFFADSDIGRADGQRIYDPKRAYLMHDKDFLKYSSTVRAELERGGFKIKQARNRDGKLSGERWNYCCPALLAESLERAARRVLVEVAAHELGLGEGFFDKLLCAGMDKLNTFVDLNCRLVVGLPGYKRPSLKE